MMQPLNPNSRFDQYGTKINRTHSPALAYGIPWVLIIFCSMTPILPVIASAPVLPPLGFITFLAWLLYRPGLMPFWAPIPLGLIDDLLSGQPIGSAVLLWSTTMLAIEAVEARLPWRGFRQDWLTASIILTFYLIFAAMISGVVPSLPLLVSIGIQLSVSVLIFPLVAKLVSLLDQFRLRRWKEVG